MKTKKDRIILFALLGTVVLVSLVILEMTYKIPNDLANMTYAERIAEYKKDFFPPTNKDCLIGVGEFGPPKEYLKVSQVLHSHLNEVGQKILDILTRPECYF